jgi:hypothetical protein
VQPHEGYAQLGGLAEFLNAYKQQVESHMRMISACRAGDWEGYLAALENMVKYFFAHDLLNYSHLMPVYLAQFG